MLDTQWQIPPIFPIPDWFLEILDSYTEDYPGLYVAQLLWGRGIQEAKTLIGFLDVEEYVPSSPFDFGKEMLWAVERLKKALETGEKISIWGDFDADGVTATSVLWEGLGQFFPQELQLSYYIPHRFQESHGLNRQGILKLAQQGVTLIVTCDTGSTNLEEINYAHGLGIDIIVTDHHTLADKRPQVVALINPRYLPTSHPLYHLSGVAVAYKLVEALYESLPNIPQQSLETLLDLVAIGLIADLVQLKGDCRYLAQRGIQQLQKSTRPGVIRLLELCKRTGDRQTDISFGIGPRINAVSRIYGDAHFCVELLTSRDVKYCDKLATETELANTRRKELQQNILKQVKKKLARVDLSTTYVLVLEDSQWPAGILGLVAGQIAQEYNRPVILLSTSEEEQNCPIKLARGSARSVQNIDLYQLVLSQSHLLHRFGGHPLAAGLSLPIENLLLFQEGINQKLRQQGINLTVPKVEADLVITVAELGRALFRELKLIEPCGMGNPPAKLLIKNCWFKNIRQNNSQDFRGKKVAYIKTTFELWDNSVKEGFKGMWWGHYQEDLPPEKFCDAVVELDYNNRTEDCEVRLIAVKEIQEQNIVESGLGARDYLLDWRDKKDDKLPASSLMLLEENPQSWAELYRVYCQAIAKQEKLTLSYHKSSLLSNIETWRQLLGIAKYLARTQTIVTQSHLKEKLDLSDNTLTLGLMALSEQGFSYYIIESQQIRLNFNNLPAPNSHPFLTAFLDGLAEERFKRQYFEQVPLDIIQEVLIALKVL